MNPSFEDIMAYREYFGDCYIAEPSDVFVVEHEGATFRAPEGETAAAFKERLGRSIREGKNFFIKEYEPYDPYPDGNAIY